MLDIVQDFLTMQQYSFERLDGSVRGSERFDALHRFSASGSDNSSVTPAFVFLLSVRAGGQGLNLTQADTCIFLDSDFNPQVDLQAEDRVHRIGQQKPVLVLRFLSQKTVEEGVLLSARKKAAIAHQVLGGFSGESSVHDDVSPRALLDAILVGAQSAIDAHTRSEDSGSSGSIDIWQGAACSIADAAALGKGSFDKYFASCDWSRVLSRHDTIDEGDVLVSGGGGAAYELDYQPLELSGGSLDVSRLQGQTAIVGTARTRHVAASARAPSATVDMSADAVLAAAAAKTESARTRRIAKWTAAGYSSLRLPPPGDEEDEHDAADVLAEAFESAAQGCMSFVVGDVARPACRAGARHYILHCVDSGGAWPDRGVFSAINRVHGTQIQDAYELAAKMKDLHLGDAHCVPLSAATSEPACTIHSVVLLVCLERLVDGSRRIELASFRRGLIALRLYCASISPDISCHFHTPMPPPPCPWYAAERELRSQLLHRLPSAAVSVYYFRRAPGQSSFGAAAAPAVRESQTCRLARAFFSDPSPVPAAQKHAPAEKPSQKQTSFSSPSQPHSHGATAPRSLRPSPAAAGAPATVPTDSAAPSPQSHPEASASSLLRSTASSPISPLFNGLKFGLHQLAWGTASLQQDVISVVTRHGGSVALNVNQPGAPIWFFAVCLSPPLMLMRRSHAHNLPDSYLRVFQNHVLFTSASARSCFTRFTIVG